MRPSEFILANAKYLADTVPGSILDTVAKKQPEIGEDETIADLHIHPYITSIDDLIDTMRVMKKNNVSLCAITTHGKGDSRERDYWTVRQMVKDDGIEHDDLYHAFRIDWQGTKLTFVGAYEMYTEVDGVGGRMDVVALMPDKGFEDSARAGMSFKDYADICDEYEALVIGAHPYTLWDPYGPGGFFRFRLATDDERSAMMESVFPRVLTVDMVASNAAWMVRSNDLLREDFLKCRMQRPLANSDAHSKNSYVRNEIGRAGNIFKLDRHENGADLREQLSNEISAGNFRTYLNYTPTVQFLISIAFDKPPKNFP